MASAKIDFQVFSAHYDYSGNHEACTIIGAYAQFFAGWCHGRLGLIGFILRVAWGKNYRSHTAR